MNIEDLGFLVVWGEIYKFLKFVFKRGFSVIRNFGESFIGSVELVGIVFWSFFCGSLFFEVVLEKLEFCEKCKLKWV